VPEKTLTNNMQRIQVGTNVYGSDGAKVGDVAEVGSNYVLIQQGWLFTKDIYVPLSAITNIDEDGVYLNVAKNEIGDMDWNRAPVAETASSSRADTTLATGTNETQPRVGMPIRDAGSEVVIPVVEEDVRVGKREVKAGGVRLDTRIEEQVVNQPVTLRDEAVHVDRRNVDEPIVGDAAADAFREGTIEVREHDEVAVVQKEARVVEEVVISKDIHERTEQIQDTVRHTDVQVEELPPTRQGTVSQTVTSGDSSIASSASTTGAVQEVGGSQQANVVDRGTGKGKKKDAGGRRRRR